MNTPRLHADAIDVWETDDDLTLTLNTGGVTLMHIRARYDGWIDEVINSAGVAGPGPSSWTLIGRELSLELGAKSAAVLGLPQDCLVRLDVDDEAISRVRAALLEILHSACYLVDTPEGRLRS
ncbi:hypothetical protein Aph02nite_33990 [Actinoplanes philippinensis]|uniref:Immunity protein 10 n=1 Tax=Actinoplanes philippinensis TaxID=35752 RepID=A0A1I2DVD7_9ACTN|nr:hypothetical protein [Actinoplanes philippinensis]GIE77449.1 hypothetical protein Aph02nite_33990 [Actinoplanes philippinensis]SFE84565.1 hypothetical protein SAMN05421541_1044 [Actinoplanes philippinensis]